ncbi:MAG TPA: cytochrome c peroxidase, partial [Candidatus Methylomirabilis sp.]|nr:cytochrome c peroxidase [Candidatus Methylomirabilis sp.]
MTWLRRSRRLTTTVGLVCVLMAALLAGPPLAAAQVNDGENLAPLWTLPVPQPTNSDIINQTAAIRLGKALFWDIQAGGDGQIACATCHFRAGADNRTMNTVNPGPNGSFEVVTGAGQEFSPHTFSVDDIVGSQGIVGSIFTSINSDPSQAADFCTSDQISPFFEHRRVTGRNTPPAVGAMFFRDNFWDGRANHRFNGLNPFGETGNAGGPPLGQVMENSSLASQSVGPPGSDTEMTCGGRPFNGPNSLGAKFLVRPPLQFQLVDPTDSVLGSVSAAPLNGLTLTYQQMIEAAFEPTLAADAVNSFSRIWGQAVQAYEATLIPDRTPFDFYMAGNNSALTQSQQRGLNRFTGKGNCVHCHAGPMFSDATVAFYAKKGAVNEDGGDQGFHNIGVRPTTDDLGRASLGPGSVSFQEINNVFNRGAFKTPHLRNLKLTAPYFHTGSKSTLADVVDFYNRGGDFANPELANRIQPLSLDAQDQADLVDFLENALLDCRVEREQAPFDHPYFPMPNGTARPAVGAAGTGTCSFPGLPLTVLAAGTGSGTVSPVAVDT